MIDPAAAQRAAANPQVSAWVAANAGSGKTRVLTERVARLLLEGARPERIICLTYTKAAAAEMQNRLFATLGGWAMMDDAPLRAALRRLTGTDFEATPPRPGQEPRTLSDARRLFAMALETPGGLKIQTIHAFCEKLLRRFPLEAGAPPEFRVMDTREASALVETLLDEMAAEPAFLDLAATVSEALLRTLTTEVIANPELFPPDVNDAEFCEAFGVPAPADKDTAVSKALRRLDSEAFGRMIAAWEQGTPAEVRKADTLKAAAAKGGGKLADELVAAMLKKDFAPRAQKSMATAAAKKAEPDALALCARLTDTALAIVEAGNAAESARRAVRLARFGGHLVARYRTAKEAGALLDFDDLVNKARALLTGADMAAWALYRLDGGVDHVLVDEAQDTSPAQWDVIRAITAEFTSGDGAREDTRTTFVVGDEKQSIYSFQGAAPGEFDLKRGLFARDWHAVGTPMEEVALEASFRSAPLILDVVDHVFDGERARGLTASGKPLRHQAFQRDKAGRVEIWPLVEPHEKPPMPDPWAPIDAVAPDNPKLRLCRMIADRIAAMLQDGEPLPGGGRPVLPGDILILLDNRPGFLGPMIAELKHRGVPVAGADRLKPGDEIGVRDLLSLMRVATTKSDDLSLAEVLRSPLCSFSDDDLRAVAHGRRGTLWSALWSKRDIYARDVAMIDDLMRQADFLRPYEFLERALVDYGGRRRMIARLGREAEDAIDELLTQAMVYETAEAPTLSGFLTWMAASDESVKREQEGARGEVRVMTCHGAKGLEAPVVILPDTMRSAGKLKGVVAKTHIGGRPRAIWRAAAKMDCRLTGAVRAVDLAAAEAEHRRLLYVAMTRAEDWLIVAGAGAADQTTGKWRGLIDEGIAGLELVDLKGRNMPAGARGAELGTTPRASAAAAEQAAAPIRAPWIDEPATVPAKLRRRAASGLAPHVSSDDESGKPWRDPTLRFADDDTERDGPELGQPLLREEARLRGDAIHLALEAGVRERAEIRLLIDAAIPDLPEDARQAVAEEAFAVRQLPEARRFFVAEAIPEAAVSILRPDGRERIVGRIDRVLVSAGKVSFVDFKSDRRVPEAGAAPPGYLLQMAAYRAALIGIYPGREIEACLLWTAAPRLDVLDGAMLDALWRKGW